MRLPSGTGTEAGSPLGPGPGQIESPGEELGRLAGELRECLPTMAAVSVRLPILKRQLESPDHLGALAELQRTVELCIDGLRSIEFDLRHPVPDRDALAPLIHTVHAGAEAGASALLRSPPVAARATGTDG